MSFISHCQPSAKETEEYVEDIKNCKLVNQSRRGARGEAGGPLRWACPGLKEQSLPWLLKCYSSYNEDVFVLSACLQTWVVFACTPPPSKGAPGLPRKNPSIQLHRIRHPAAMLNLLSAPL